MEKKVKLLGTISIILGIAAAILCVMPDKGILYAIFTGFLGLIISNIYILLNTRHQINKNTITPGLIGLVLSSSPVLVILFFIFRQKLGM